MLSGASTSVERPQVQVNTFYLLWCQGCGHADEPGSPTEQPDFVAPLSEAMRCNDCGEHLHLIECFTGLQSKMWQVKPGAMWQHVIYADELPKPKYGRGPAGRSIWVNR